MQVNLIIGKQGEVFMQTRTIEKVVHKVPLQEQPSDFAFWQTRSPQERLAALEHIRQEYHHGRYDAEPRLQRFYQIIKR